MEDEACEHVVTLLVGIFSLFAFSNVELPEEVERQNGVDVTHNRQEAHGKDQLFAVVCDSLEDDTQGRHTNSNINEMGSKEEVVVVAKHRKDEVEQKVQEVLKKKICNIVLFQH